jgi:SAM-dependent methyltransferase
MRENLRWQQAQSAEKGYWEGLRRGDAAILRDLVSKQEQADRLKDFLPKRFSTSIEVGIGPIGVGLSAFLKQAQARIGIDPLERLQFQCDPRLLAFVESLRESVIYVKASGESLPIGSQTVDLAVCANVLDHVSNAEAVLSEIHRVLKPGGLFDLEVDTFSMAGLAKWSLWTQRRHRNEILVQAHPYRFRDQSLALMLNARGFEIVRRIGRTWADALLGASRPSLFVAVKR